MRNLSFLLIPVLLLSLFGCAPIEGRNALSILLSSPIDAEVTVSLPDITYTATLHLAAVNETGSRPYEITLLSPPSLSHYTVLSSGDGRAEIKKGELSFPLSDDSSFTLAVFLLSPAEILGRAPEVRGGEKTAVLTAADGRIFTLKEDGGIASVSLCDVTLSVLWLEGR